MKKHIIKLQPIHFNIPFIQDDTFQAWEMNAQNLWKSFDGYPLWTAATGTNKVKVLCAHHEANDKMIVLSTDKVFKISFGAQVMGIWNKNLTKSDLFLG